MTKISLYGIRDESPVARLGHALQYTGAMLKEAFILDNEDETSHPELTSANVSKNDLIELTLLDDQLWHGDLDEFYSFLVEKPNQQAPSKISIQKSSAESQNSNDQKIKQLRIYRKKPKAKRSTVRSEGALDEILKKSGPAFENESIKSPEIEIRISMGDLGFASYPVLVGHVEGDGLYNAEKALDTHLDGALSELHSMDGYPGKVGTAEFFTDDLSNHPGAIVVGLGTDFENISGGTLMFCVKKAAIKRSLYHRKKRGAPNISTLLIGSGYAGLSLREAIRAILLGIKNANIQIVKEGKKQRPIRILEFIELYEAKALAAAYVIQSIISESEFSCYKPGPSDTIRRVPGVRQTIETGLQASWWHRIKVEEEPNDSDQDTRIQPFRFTVITGKARADEIILPTNRGIVDDLVQEAVHQSTSDERVSHALFELMIPNEFKTYGTEQRNILWILSKKAAEYPWEMMHDPSRGEKKPLSVRAGMIRQLTTRQFRLNPERAEGRNALVIGSPNAGKTYPRLPAAEKEAKSVSTIFRKNGFPNTPSINESSSEIIKLVCHQDYRIIHLSGHGSLGKEKDGLGGMVIGRGKLLTSVEFNQKGTVPELVFINCCYLAKSDNQKEKRFADRHKLAANLGIQFIEMGVKAVVAAGWTIDDDLAKLFADTFYKSMFDGHNFGEAVFQARKKIFEKDPQSNTWGAYQCYGEPSFTLTSKKPKSTKQQFNFVDPLEVIIRIDNVTNASAAASFRNPKGNKSELEELIKQIPKSWKKQNGPILESIARCYATLDLFDQSIKYYEQLLKLNVSNYSVLALEQLANVKFRWAIENMQSENASKELLAKGKKYLKEAVKHLEILLKLGRTTVRLNLMASALKRKSILETRPERRMKLWKASFEHYKEAHDKVVKETQRVDDYPLLSYLTLTEILVKYGVQKVNGKQLLFRGTEIVKALQLCEQHSEEDDFVNPNFWDLSVRAPIYTYLTLIAFPNRLRTIKKYYKGSLFKRDEDFQFHNRIIYAYKKAWLRGGTFHEKRKVLEHLDFIIEAVDLSKAANKKDEGSFSAIETERMSTLHAFFVDLKSSVISRVFNQPD